MWQTHTHTTVSVFKTLRLGTEVNSIITLLLEVDVVFLPEPSVGQVARIRLCLARKLGILGYVNSDVLRW